MAEDPTAFDYDGIYDLMKKETLQQEIQIKAEKSGGKKPKYVETILATHKERKREQDIIYNRNLLKEKDKEGNLFSDKDKFITPSYKKKLAEDKLWEEEKQRKEEREGDVTKRKNFEGFFGNFINSVAATKQATIQATKPQQEKPQPITKPIQETKKKIEEPIKQTEKIPPPHVEVPKPVSPPVSPKETESDKKRKIDEEEAKEKKKQEEEVELAKKLARKTDDAAVADARERYFQRKAAAKAGDNSNIK